MKWVGWLVGSRADVDELSKGVIAMEWAALIAGLVMLIALPIIIFFFVQRLVVKPLSELQNFCEQVEQTKDFTLRTPVHGEDEVGKTADSVARLLNALREAFTQILERVKRLESASTDLTSSAEVTATNSESASDSASAMAASVQELSVGINQISDSANEASNISIEAGKQSSEGGKIILDTTHEMNSIALSMKSTSEVISDLGEETKKISGIVDVITDVAEQTNLLALNAAIEAARAGETGRGFAVVADEVRKLAERTRKATDEISGVIGSIQLRSDQAVASMSETMSQIEKGEALATQAGIAINEIRSGSGRVVEVVRLITESLVESNAASQSMANQTERVAQVAEESNHAAKRSKVSADEVVKISQEVRDTVQQFKI
ncbi:MAG: methyl-accepting chemotaxis protein [Betaproteobacteria bacterium]